jgi:hypothetical protein
MLFMWDGWKRAQSPEVFFGGSHKNIDFRRATSYLVGVSADLVGLLFSTDSLSQKGGCS